MKAIREKSPEGRKEERTPARHDDSYRFDPKMPGPVCCPRCGATYRRGRWTWATAEADMTKHMCPACHRIIGVESLPGGVLVTTTHAHLAQALALAVHESYKGDLDLDFGRDESMLRATWSR